jgi:hypothetical protein
MKKELNMLNWSIILLGAIILFSDIGWYFVEGNSKLQANFSLFGMFFLVGLGFIIMGLRGKYSYFDE